MGLRYWNGQRCLNACSCKHYSSSFLCKDLEVTQRTISISGPNSRSSKKGQAPCIEWYSLGSCIPGGTEKSTFNSKFVLALILTHCGQPPSQEGDVTRFNKWNNRKLALYAIWYKTIIAKSQNTMQTMSTANICKIAKLAMSTKQIRIHRWCNKSDSKIPNDCDY